MIIEIPKISPEGSRYAGEESADILELVPGQGVRTEDAVRYDLSVGIVSGGVMVQGRVWTTVGLQCGRCAELYSTFLADSDFIRDYPLREGQLALDITADLREAVLLLLPAYPVCGEHCRGLCPRCGRNLNEGPCGCEPEPPAASGAWQALDELKL